MASLTAHLRRPGDHGRLTFHPECPLCCGDRLAGQLPADAVVGRRTGALLAAGVLALSTATPTAVLAAEPDQEQEGATAPDQAAAQAPASGPAYDPGGASTDVPFDAAPAPPPDEQPVPESAGDDAGLIEQEAATNDDVPVADSGDGSGSPAPAQQSAPPAVDVAPAPPTPATTTPEPPPVSSPAPETPTTGAPATPPAPSGTAPTRPAKEKKASRANPAPDESTPSAPAASAPTSPESSAPSTVLVVQAQPSSSQRSSGTANRGRAAQPGDRAHVVAPGESLWSIAGDLVGDGASVARTAREVSRLWELNRSQIGTGDPDLLMVGTRLVLR
jgi:nucleoid-associated protein YgaU